MPQNTELMNESTYYQKVADYYDEDARDFEERYWNNAVLQRIRQSFREEVKKFEFDNALEIGYGPGLDVCHFAQIFPDKDIYGLDISPAMHKHTESKARSLGLNNVNVKVGTPEDLDKIFPGVKFDHIYVFFGALNTVEDLEEIASALNDRLADNGTMLLTFVNKWYLMEVFYHLAKVDFKKAFKRFKTVWGGYSGSKILESKCLSPGEIKGAFENHFTIEKKKGYSILYPAWYRHRWVKKMGKRVSEFLWDFDKSLDGTPFWSLGEYALYTFKKKK
ncbi:class I SAM-dependent methyltransferase [Pleomorphovibrio marinus]|uniref:class I SAM-dependent methyltransferase n=1 Tax=Pleomorphovibrio marinus TaxID=2164132 RepID=UPI001300859E|nr:class I SAM-dependent methyltransferase [Pleomorphovibrio marinus]